LTPESEEFAELVGGVCEGFNRFNLSYRDLEEFGQLRMDINGLPIGNAIDSGSITAPMAVAYWDALKRAGAIDFANIIFHSYQLLRRQDRILRYVSAKFAWMLVDEFQDTSDLQCEILALIASKDRTSFLFVGDQNQSIFSFAGARPDLAIDLARRVGANLEFGLSGNFRSSNPIVALAECIIARDPPMEALGHAKDFVEEPRRVHGDTPFELVTDYFLPAIDELEIPLGNCAILAPTWFTLYPLGRKLREFGTPIVGPGARPYRRDRLFAPLAEMMCAYLLEPSTELICGLERTLFHAIQNSTGRARFDVFSYRGRRAVFELIAIARELRRVDRGAIHWLEEASVAVSTLLITEEFLTEAEKNLLPLSVEEMKVDMRINRVDIDNLSVDDLGIYASPGGALKLSTLHNAKGREFDGVAIIDMHEGRLPSYFARTAEAVAEQKRLFYVGVTRARRLLMLMTDDVDRRNGPSRFFAECGL